MSVVRESARVVRAAIDSWPSTLRLCLVLVCAGLAGGVLIAVARLVSSAV